MTIDEMIFKFSLELATKDGKEGIMVYGKPGKRQIEELKANKELIMIELKRRNAVKEEQRAAEHEEKKIKIQNIKSGKEKIKVGYHEGEYLSAYSVHGEAASLLVDLGLAEWVAGWGCMIKDKTIEALGKEFTYQAAVEYIKPELERKEKLRVEKENKKKAIFDKAKETGEKQILSSWNTECNDPNEECSMDIVTLYAMPDGTEKTTRQHTW